MANISQSILQTLIQRSSKVDPALLDAFTLIAQELDRLGFIVDPAPTIQKKVKTTIYPPPLNVTVFNYTLTGTNLILSWEAPQDGYLLYEVRRGSSWSSATRLFVTASLQAALDPIAVGSTTYLVKAINSSGVYSADAFSVTVTVNPIGIFTLTPFQINNFVSIDWDVPSSIFNISYYIITKDGTTVINRLPGTFYSYQEVTAGTYQYGVTAVDIAGNQSSEITISLDVNAPTDFDYEASLTSDLSGTIVNGKVDNSKLIVCVDTTTTFEDHFINNSWASPQDQVDAGYPLYIQPTEATGSYQETFDFGAVFTNVIVNLSWLFEVYTGDFNFGIDARVSDDNVTYSSPYTTVLFFVTSARYVKVKLTFTGSDDKALMAFYNFICTLAVKREVDGGDLDVFAADASGTVVTFNKAFKFVESITVTPQTTVEQKAVYDFAGGVDPTTFKVKVYDAAGTRADAHVSWKARGVL